MTAKTKTRSDSFQEPKDFEAALERLQALVESLEGGEVPLEESIAAFEEGQKLVQYCQNKLRDAETSLKKLLDEGEELPGEDDEE